MPSFEVLLPVGAIAFYLFDAALMLYGNEMVLERGSLWRGSLGLPAQIGGRRLYLPNPFTPQRLLFRVRWDRPAAGESAPLDVDAWQRAASPIGKVVALQAMLLLMVLPPVSILLGAGTLLLAVFVAFYALSLVALGLLLSRRDALGVSGRQAALLAAESLLCAPFALNLVRKISLAQSGRLGWLSQAERSFAPRRRRELLGLVCARIDELLIVEEAGSAGAGRLEALRTQLKARLDVPVLA